MHTVSPSSGTKQRTSFIIEVLLRNYWVTVSQLWYPKLLWRQTHTCRHIRTPTVFFALKYRRVYQRHLECQEFIRHQLIDDLKCTVTQIWGMIFAFWICSSLFSSLAVDVVTCLLCFHRESGWPSGGGAGAFEGTTSRAEGRYWQTPDPQLCGHLGSSWNGYCQGQRSVIPAWNEQIHTDKHVNTQVPRWCPDILAGDLMISFVLNAF